MTHARVSDVIKLRSSGAAMALAIGLAAALAPGCRREAVPTVAKAAPAEPAPASIREYSLVGTVRGIKKDAGQVIIRHEEVPGFMEAMTMPFTLKDRGPFEDLAVGDEVEAKLRVESEGGVVKDYELVDLVVRRPALAPSPSRTPTPSLRLSLSGVGPQLNIIPKQLEPGETVPDFTMTTEEGGPLKLSDLRGNVVVLTFIYTRCPLPDFCPLMDRKFAELAAAIGAVPDRARHVRLISLSFDPEHDTPEMLKKHALTQGARAPLWTFAVARHDELAKVAPALGLTYGPTATEIGHNLSTAVIDPRGKLAKLLVGPEAKSWKPTELLKVISPLANELKPKS
jgi:protein SCO1